MILFVFSDPVSRLSFSKGEMFFYWKEFESSPYHGWTDTWITAGKYDNLKEELLFNRDNEVNIRNVSIMSWKSAGFMKQRQSKP